MLAAATPKPLLTWNDLAPDQRKVLFALACGLSDPAIAEALDMPLSVVRSSVTYLLQTLHLSDRVEAILWVLGHEAVAAEVLATVSSGSGAATGSPIESGDRPAQLDMLEPSLSHHAVPDVVC